MKVNCNYFVFNVVLCLVVLHSNYFREGEALLFKTKAAYRFLHKHISSEAYLGTGELIRRYKYPVETHTVQTEDGYILTLFRIPFKKSPHYKTDPLEKVPQNVSYKGPVFLQHGFVASSDVWLLLEENSFAYLLANAGYDVWLGNIRDTEYSTHKTFTKDDLKYWDYSYHELGKYDVPAMIHHVLDVTGERQLTWIGHSMGTTMYFVAMDLYPELQKSVKTAVLFAPVAYICNTKSPIMQLGNFSSRQLEIFFKAVSGGRVIPEWLKLWTNRYGPKICVKRFAAICWHFYALFGGPNPLQYDRKVIQKAIGHVPGDSASRIGVHYAQGLKNCDFRRYDYGTEENFKLYGQRLPPAYNLSKIHVPTLVVTGDGDWISTPKDATRTASELGYVQKFIQVDDPMWAHFDFIYGKDAPTLLYKVVIDFLSTGPLQYIPQQPQPQYFHNIQSHSHSILYY